MPRRAKRTTAGWDTCPPAEMRRSLTGRQHRRAGRADGTQVLARSPSDLKLLSSSESLLDGESRRQTTDHALAATTDGRSLSWLVTPNGNGVQRPHPGERPGVVRCNDGLGDAPSDIRSGLFRSARLHTDLAGGRSFDLRCAELEMACNRLGGYGDDGQATDENVHIEF